MGASLQITLEPQVTSPGEPEAPPRGWARWSTEKGGILSLPPPFLEQSFLKLYRYSAVQLSLEEARGFAFARLTTGLPFS